MRKSPAALTAATLCAAFAAAWLHAASAQVLSSASTMNSEPGHTEPGAMLAGSPRALRPSFATRLTSPAVMAADEPSLAVPLQIPFAAGSAHLTASATHLLDHLGQALTAGPLAADRLRIEGHADANGAADANNDIAERRALAVAAYLEQNFAVSPARLACVGQGTSPPRQRVVLISRLASG